MKKINVIRGLLLVILSLSMNLIGQVEALKLINDTGKNILIAEAFVRDQSDLKYGIKEMAESNHIIFFRSYAAQILEYDHICTLGFDQEVEFDWQELCGREYIKGIWVVVLDDNFNFMPDANSSVIFIPIDNLSYFLSCCSGTNTFLRLSVSTVTDEMINTPRSGVNYMLLPKSARPQIGSFWSLDLANELIIRSFKACRPFPM